MLACSLVSGGEKRNDITSTRGIMVLVPIVLVYAWYNFVSYGGDCNTWYILGVPRAPHHPKPSYRNNWCKHFQACASSKGKGNMKMGFDATTSRSPAPVVCIVVTPGEHS